MHLLKEKVGEELKSKVFPNNLLCSLFLSPALVGWGEGMLISDQYANCIIVPLSSSWRLNRFRVPRPDETFSKLLSPGGEEKVKQHSFLAGWFTFSFTHSLSVDMHPNSCPGMKSAHTTNKQM